MPTGADRLHPDPVAASPLPCSPSALSLPFAPLGPCVRLSRRKGAGAQVPGAATGLLARQVKIAGSGPNPQVIEEYVVDVSLLRELRETQKQAAQELGHWAQRKEPVGSDAGPAKVEVVYVNDWRTRDAGWSVRHPSAMAAGGTTGRWRGTAC